MGKGMYRERSRATPIHPSMRAPAVSSHDLYCWDIFILYFTYSPKRMPVCSGQVFEQIYHKTKDS